MDLPRFFLTTTKRLRSDHFKFFLFVSMALNASGCGVGLIKEVALAPNEAPALGQAVTFNVKGAGQCDAVRIDWGDGAVEDATKFTLEPPQTISHTYTGWGGGKTVTVFGMAGCEGTVRARINIPPPTTSIGYVAGLNTCDPVPNRPPLAARSLVKIQTIPVTGPYSFGIDFGCPFQSCRHDANGRVGAAPAASPYPFPGLVEYSLVLRVGTEVFQGGTNVQFTSTQAAPLELCLNDFSLANNTGGYQIDISVDQLGPVIP